MMLLSHKALSKKSSTRIIIIIIYKNRESITNNIRLLTL